MAGISAASLVMAPCSTTDMAQCARRPPQMPMSPVSRSSVRNDSNYADGVYTATGQYGSLPSFITVTVTLAHDVITAVEVTPMRRTRHPSTSAPLRCRGPGGRRREAIDEVNVGRLAGSSGTPVGFNAAIERIKEQARLGQPPRNDFFMATAQGRDRRWRSSGFRSSSSTSGAFICSYKLTASSGAGTATPMSICTPDSAPTSVRHHIELVPHC